MTYKEARVYLDKLSKYGSVLGLDRIKELMRELKDPQEGIKFIHIAGTNGKGSVLTYTSAILAEAGLRVGTYTSPSVISYLEKIKVDGVSISEDEFSYLIGKVKEAAIRMTDGGKTSPTVFEAETAAAFLYFKMKHCDIVALESGLGGSLDATNIIKNTQAAVFTSISMDHMEILGDTIEKIAENKAGIIKKGCVVVTAHQAFEAMCVLKKRAEALGCNILGQDEDNVKILEENDEGTTFSYKNWQNIHISMAGRYQPQNAAVVLELVSVLRETGYQISDEAVYAGFSKAVLAGRFTCLCKNPLFIADGAHNEDAAYRLKESVRSYFPNKRLIYIIGVFKDKDYNKIAKIMAPMATKIYTINLPDKKRTLPAGRLKEALAPYCAEIRAAGSIEAAAAAAIEEAKDNDVILAFGSLSYLGRLIEYVKNTRKNN